MALNKTINTPKYYFSTTGSYNVINTTFSRPLFVSLFLPISLCLLSLFLSVSLSVPLSVSLGLSLSLCFSQSLSLSVSLCLSFTLSLFLPVHSYTPLNPQDRYPTIAHFRLCAQTHIKVSPFLRSSQVHYISAQSLGVCL